MSVLLLACGVTLVAMAGATGNSLQERMIDRNLQRTAQRPLVRNEASPCFAFFLALILLCSGLLLFTRLASNQWIVTTLTLLALAIYNGVYTPLKQRTLLAIFPGGVCGALPPLVGWSGAGGELFSYVSLLLFVLLFLWQIPHFCFILLRHKEDYRQSAQPNFLQFLSEEGVRRISITWIGGLALVMLLFCLIPVVTSAWQIVLICTNAIGLATFCGWSLARHSAPPVRRLFLLFNVMLGNHMSLFIVSFLLR